TVLAYGGLDILVSNAGIAHSAPVVRLELADWERSFAVNSTGHFIVAREAMRLLTAQGLGGALVFVATKNVMSPGKDFAAYSAAKAAEAQLAKVLALEGAPYGIRSNIVNPDAVFQDSKLWSDEIRRERAAAQGITVDRLEEFYRTRNLLGVGIVPEDVAEAVLFLASDRSAKTTGCSVTVDGGVRDAFPRCSRDWLRRPALAPSARRAVRAGPAPGGGRLRLRVDGRPCVIPQPDPRIDHAAGVLRADHEANQARRRCLSAGAPLAGGRGQAGGHARRSVGWSPGVRRLRRR